MTLQYKKKMNLDFQKKDEEETQKNFQNTLKELKEEFNDEKKMLNEIITELQTKSSESEKKNNPNYWRIKKKIWKKENSLLENIGTLQKVILESGESHKNEILLLKKNNLDQKEKDIVVVQNQLKRFRQTKWNSQKR